MDSDKAYSMRRAIANASRVALFALPSDDRHLPYSLTDVATECPDVLSTSMGSKALGPGGVR